PQSGLGDMAKPYPANVGTFWGWGWDLGETNPATPTGTDLIKAVLQPQCAFAGENAAVLGMGGTYSDMGGFMNFWNSKARIQSIINQLPGGIRQALRKNLET